MRDRLATENLWAGDKVIVISASVQSRTEYIGSIIRKTPTGLVDVHYNNSTVTRFNKNGDEYGASGKHYYRSTWIERYTEERADTIRKRDRRAKIIDFLNKRDWNIYEDEELEQILRFVTMQRST